MQNVVEMQEGANQAVGLLMRVSQMSGDSPLNVWRTAVDSMQLSSVTGVGAALLAVVLGIGTYFLAERKLNRMPRCGCSEFHDRSVGKVLNFCSILGVGAFALFMTASSLPGILNPEGAMVIDTLSKMSGDRYTKVTADLDKLHRVSVTTGRPIQELWKVHAQGVYSRAQTAVAVSLLGMLFSTSLFFLVNRKLSKMESGEARKTGAVFNHVGIMAAIALLLVVFASNLPTVVSPPDSGPVIQIMK